MKRHLIIATLLVISSICSIKTFAQSGNSLSRLIDSISVVDKELTLIVVGYEGCGPCAQLKNSAYFKNLTIGKTYLDILNSREEKFFSQLFFITGFPTSIVMDAGWNLKSIVLGYRDYEARMDSVLNLGVNMYDIRLKSVHGQKGTEKEQAVAMFDNALKAVRCYWQGDYKQMESFALKSRENGDYLFNNYLLYLTAVKSGNADMALHYKNEIATRFSDEMNRMVYAEIFTELQL